MKKVLALLLALSLLLCGCTQTSAVSPFRKFDDDAVKQSIANAAQTYFTEKKLTGLTVGIIREGKVAFFNYGNTTEGGAPITEDTRFEIGSLTKTLTATILASLSLDPTVRVERDGELVKFDRNDRADDYLPYGIKLEKDGEPVRLWQLAAHVSGLPRMPDNFKDGQNPYAEYSQFELVDYLENAYLQTKPGESYLYSNLGFGLLGWIMGRAMGTQFDALMQSRILNPLGMDRTAFTLTEEQEALRAKPHSALGTEISQWDFDVLAPCGGLKSTSHDLIRFVAANLGELDLEWQTLVAGIKETQQKYYEGDGRTIGLGFHFSQLDGKTVYTHNGATGGYRSYLGFLPDTGTGVVVLCNNAIDVDALGIEALTLLQP
ncbi:MAG: class A beta-lactamase-related serine hydrolase [Clostridia bacterium]|nr:class A beta-lactamase-related serine hydrolase [Clostridia bacterium]